MDADSLRHSFFGCVQSGDLATAEEIAGTIVEILRLRRDLGEDVTVPLARWQSRQTLLHLIY